MTAILRGVAPHLGFPTHSWKSPLRNPTTCIRSFRPVSNGQSDVCSQAFAYIYKSQISSFRILISENVASIGETPGASRKSQAQHLRIVISNAACSEEPCFIRRRLRVVHSSDVISGDRNSMNASSLAANSPSAPPRTQASSQQKLIRRLFSEEYLLQSTTTESQFLTEKQLLLR
jgi:hypothetical protein